MHESAGNPRKITLLHRAFCLRYRIAAARLPEVLRRLSHSQKGYPVKHPVRVVRVCALAVFCILAAASTHAATHSVPAGGDLQAAINLAQPGDVILLASGATYIGNFRLPVKPEAASFITIRTDAPAASLPAPGVRTSPSYAAVLAKIRSANGSAAMTADAGAHHWRLENLEFMANANGAGDIIVLGGSGSQTQLSQMPHHFVLDRLFIHGDPTLGQKRGIALNSGTTEVINSYISDIKAVGIDTQAIGGWNGSGPYLIQNNHLEAAGENVMFGGADPSIPDLVPSDITIRRNLFTKPLQWRQERWQVKNAFELKNARRVLVEGNIFEHVWVAAQSGFAILFSTRNQNGRALWSIVEDVTFRYNIIRHASNAINISGYDNERPSQQGRRYHIAHNLVYDIGGPQWGGSGIFLQIGNEPRDIVIEHNTVSHTGHVVSVYGLPRRSVSVVDGFLFRDNLMRHNAQGVKGDGAGAGQQTLTSYFSNAVFERNALAGGDPARYPPGNYFPAAAEFDALFRNAPAGDYTLVPGSPYATAASDGTALGADMTRLNAAVFGRASEAEGIAVCRPGRACRQEPPPRQRP